MVFRIKVRAGFRSSGCLEDGPPTAQGLGWGSIMGTLKVGSPPKPGVWGQGSYAQCVCTSCSLLPAPPSLPRQPCPEEQESTLPALNPPIAPLRYSLSDGSTRVHQKLGS